MARRRRRALRRALAGGIEGVQDVMDLYLRQKQQEKLYGSILGRQQSMDLLNRRQELQSKVASGELLMDQAASMWEADTGEKEDFSRFMPSMERRLAGVSKDIQGASTLSGLMTPTGVRRRAAAAQVPDIKVTHRALAEEETPEGMAPFEGNVEPSDELADLLKELEERSTALQAEVPFTPVSDIGPEGVGRSRYVPQNRLGTLGPLQTERTGPQAGARTGEEAVAAQPGQTTAKAAELRTLTPEQIASDLAKFRSLSPFRVREAGATRGAQLAAEGTPEALDVLTRKSAIEAGNKPPSQTEARAADFATRGTRAHEVMLKLEPEMAKRGIIVNLASLNAPNTLQDPVTRQYATAMRELINANLRRESGAAIQPSEYDMATKQYTFRAGDDPATLKYKQDARRRSISGMVTESGRVLGGKFVSLAELEALAKAQNTTVEHQLERARAERFEVIW